jgi:hypothetical protein
MTDQTATFVVERDGQPDLRFTGTRLGEVSDKDSPRSPGEEGRWHELALYRTQSGKYVCAKIARSTVEGERDRHEAKVVDPAEATNVSWRGTDDFVRDSIVGFFGFQPLAKALYRAAGVDAAEQID